MSELSYDEILGYIILATLGFPLLLYILAIPFGLVVVENKTSIIVERFGKNPRKLYSGWYFLLPLIDRIRPLKFRYLDPHLRGNKVSTIEIEKELQRIDLREAVMEFPNQHIITRDNLIYRIHDPYRAVYEVYDLSFAVQQLIQTTLRSIIGDMGLDDTLASRAEINSSLLNSIYQVCYNWGIEITSVELLEIQATNKDVAKSMQKQLISERTRRSCIVESHGERERLKFRAEGDFHAKIAYSKGDQQKNIIICQGEAEKKVLIAKAYAKCIELLSKECQKYNIDPFQYLIAIRYLSTLQNICKNSTTLDISWPLESDVSGLFNLKKA